MGNFVPKAQHASSYWQEVARTMQAVNTGEKPAADSQLNPQGHAKADFGKPAGLNKPQKANP
ncbi:hypothetical protein ZL58_14345 [Salmonella enterica subsp. enterica serovar Typhimurium]|nr:hypothetical protein [Salmonella enterica subsp. enterica serovar Typhimurium]